jgi:hypothetical protein
MNNIEIIEKEIKNIRLTKWNKEGKDVMDLLKMNKYREKFNRLKTEKELFKKELKSKNTQLLENKKLFENLIKAQNIIQEVAQQTQNEIKFFITDVVNMALQSIPFKDPPDSFEIEFVTRRNQIECDLYYLKNGYRLNPILSQGGGVLSVTSFALLLACWSLQNKKNNTIIFDEPFKDINDPDNELNLKFYIGEMIKKVSKLLNIQLIIVGSNGNYDEIADKLIKI